MSAQIDEQIKKLEGLYAEIDAQLRLYSEKANNGDRSAMGHYDQAERLRFEAHALVSTIGVAVETELAPIAEEALAEFQES